MKLERCKIAKYPEIAKEIEKLKIQGYGLRAIKEIITQKHGIEFSHQTVANYLDSKGLSMEILIESDNDLKTKANDWQNRFRERYEKICDWTDDLGKMIEKLKIQLSSEEYLRYAPTIIALSREILNQLDFIRKEQERIENKKTGSHLSNMQRLEETIKTIKEFENEGWIKINPEYISYFLTEKSVNLLSN